VTTGKPPLRHSWLSSDRAVARLVARPLREFMHTEAAGGILLLVATLVALAWANSPVRDSYEKLWTIEIGVRIGDFELTEDLRHWVNDGLMAIFFFVVGLEIKRELVAGELNDPRKAALPAFAALGGMVVPALIYAMVNGRGAGSAGWAIPMATDIAFAVGVLSLMGRRCPDSLRTFLLSLAIVDDIGAILVIALFYTGGLEWRWVAAAFAVVVAVLALERLHVRAVVPYAVLGAVLWYATYRAGVHPTVAGVALGLLTPARPFQRPRAVSNAARRTADMTSDEPDPGDGDAQRWLHLSWLSREAVAPLARVEHALLPWTTFVVVPLFALANSGVDISWDAVRGAATHVVSVGVFAGLVIGKPLGVAVGALIGVRSRATRLPAGVGWRDLVGMGATAGIGFTVALFVAELAFTDPVLRDRVKISILLASIVAAISGSVTLRWASRARSAGQ
jgi:NhaA family Na+:H+ antiporter